MAVQPSLAGEGHVKPGGDGVTAGSYGGPPDVLCGQMKMGRGASSRVRSRVRTSRVRTSRGGRAREQEGAAGNSGLCQPLALGGVRAWPVMDKC